MRRTLSLLSLWSVLGVACSCAGSPNSTQQPQKRPLVLAPASSEIEAAPAPAPSGEAPAAPIVEPEAEPETPAGWEEVERLFSRPSPKEVPLVGSVFDASDPLLVRVEKWKALSKKEKPQKKIVIEKKARLLTVFLDEDPIIRHVVELGFSPEGDKEWEGDGKTPEGQLYVCTKNDKSKFHRFLGLAYPLPDDATRGFAAKKISATQRDEILAAHRSKKAPLWNTALGGEVGIHGGGEFLPQGKRLFGFDWTWGCIAITNEQILSLFTFAEIGTPVEIRP